MSMLVFSEPTARASLTTMIQTINELTSMLIDHGALDDAVTEYTSAIPTGLKVFGWEE